MANQAGYYMPKAKILELTEEGRLALEESRPEAPELFHATRPVHGSKFAPTPRSSAPTSIQRRV